MINITTHIRNIIILVYLLTSDYEVFAQMFIDVTDSVGIGLNMPAAGASTFDFNNDGWLDILQYNGQAPSNYSSPILLKNLGNGQFSDITITSGLNPPLSIMPGVSWTDVDNDGNIDLHLNIFQSSAANRLFYNTGNGTFEDITIASKTAGKGYGQSSVWLDYNNDGLLDLFATYQGYLGSALYKNNGDKTFTDVSIQAGISKISNAGSLVVGDFNNDEYPDVYVISGAPGEVNNLYINKANGTFRDSASTFSLLGTNLAEWAGASADYNNDGLTDLFIAGENGVHLFKNTGDIRFRNVKDEVGLTRKKFVISIAVADFDNDGFQDFIAIESDSIVMYRYDGSKFVDMTVEVGLNKVYNGYGACWFDYDNDGDLDLYLACLNNKSRLFENNFNINNATFIRLKGSVSNRLGLGATINAYANGKMQKRDFSHTTGKMNQSPPFIHFGFGQTASIDSLVIRWPSGIKQKFYLLAARGIYQFTEPNVTHNVSVQKTYGNPGDTVFIPIKVSSSYGIAGGDIEINYDSLFLKAFDVRRGTVTKDFSLAANTTQAGKVKVSFARATSLKMLQPGSLFIIGTVLSRTMTQSDSSIRLSKVQLINDSLEVIQTETVNNVVSFGLGRGEVSIDGTISAADAILCLKIVAELFQPDERQYWAADYDGDAYVTSYDAVGILRAAVGLGTTPPSGGSTNQVLIRIPALTLQAGTTSDVPMIVHNFNPISGKVKFSFDPTSINIEGVTVGGVILNNIFTSGLLQTNEYVFSFAGTGNSGTQDNNIVFVRIKAKRTISTTSIKIREVELFDDAGQKAIHIIGITNIEREIEIPSQFCLLQNYPNPFNPTTTINYQLSTNSHIQMKVFDVLGREIITLVDETKGAGDYTVQWNAINFPNGVYYCRLNAGSIMKIVKMILMK